MTGYFGSIEKQTLKNKYFRRVLFTGKHAQLVVMCLKGGEEIGNEVHHDVDQFFRIEKGELRFVFNNGKEVHVAKDGDGVVVPAGTWHNVINISKEESKLYTVYSPPNHPDGTIHKTKAEAEKAEEEAHKGSGGQR
jgi:mannose-6-phosphate isomerase-like protein (cupin superfamily)